MSDYRFSVLICGSSCRYIVFVFCVAKLRLVSTLPKSSIKAKLVLFKENNHHGQKRAFHVWKTNVQTVILH